jgi:beta-lactamase regulating signal transducer with metallopeptidase domain
VIAYENWGLTLVHFVWQGLYVAAALGVALRLLQGRRPEIRYAFAVAALVLMVMLPIVTLVMLESREPAAVGTPGSEAGASWLDLGIHPEASPRDAAPAPAATPMAAGSAAVNEGGASRPPDAGLPARLGATLRPLLVWIVGLWALGALTLSIRLLGGWSRLRRLTRLEGPAVPRYISDSVCDLTARLGVSRPVRLVRSAAVTVPAVVGWLRPVILLPVSLLSGLTPAQIELILAHEIAHIRRHDYLVNVFQAIVETLLFYHPAVWWVSRRIREEREHCCDDLAVTVCGDRRLYAGALLDLEVLRAPRPGLALGADGTSLVARVRRLLEPDDRHAELLPRGTVAFSSAGLAIATVVALGTASLLTALPPVDEASGGPPGESAGSGSSATVFLGEAFGDRVFRYEVTEGGLADLDRVITTGVAEPGGLALSPWGELFVSNRTGSVARFLDPAGAATPNGLITTGAAGEIVEPHWLTFRDDELFLTQGDGTVQRFRFDEQRKAVPNGALGTGPSARGIEVNPSNGELLVARLDNTIHRFRFDPSGRATATQTMRGGGMTLHAMTFTPWGELLVVEYFGDAISRFTFDGSGNPVPNGVITGGNMSGPIDLDFSPWGELFVTNHNELPGTVTRWLFEGDGPSAVPVYNGSFEVPGNLGGIRFWDR